MHGNVLQTTSRALFEQVADIAPRDRPNTGAVASREWGSLPDPELYREVPVIDVVHDAAPGR